MASRVSPASRKASCQAKGLQRDRVLAAPSAGSWLDLAVDMDLPVHPAQGFEVPGLLGPRQAVASVDVAPLCPRSGARCGS